MVLRPALSTVWLWLLVVTIACLLDFLLAPKVDALALSRPPVGSVRMNYPTETTLAVANDSSRTVRATLRDAWQPTAGATDNRHRVRLSPGDRTMLRTPLLPRRRGDLRAFGVTVRVPGPLGLVARQRTRDVPGFVRSLPPFESRKHLPSRLARLRDLDGRSAVRVRGQGTEFDSLREYVRGDDVRSIDWRAIGPQPQRRGPHLAARARPPGGAGARHVAYVGRPGRRRTPARLGDGRRPAAGRPGRPGR